MRLPEGLEQTLVMAAELCAPADDPWWIIASAAVALHGAPVEDVRDVDLLMSGSDARAALLRVGVEPKPGSVTDLFRSAVFGTWQDPPLPVEIFGDFEFAGPDGWSRVAPITREPVTIGDHILFIQSAAELKQMLIGFGRPERPCPRPAPAPRIGRSPTICVRRVTRRGRRNGSSKNTLQTPGPSE